ncbi:hypothetical protein NE865_00139 [Phthorimaea operculella]|nr:hypothetical protein NE865_00139 [Phthorimaea operculella]
MMIRLNNFLYVFNLRQGTILIAVHQIALSSFILIILLVGISHVREMLSMLHNDMEDDAERRGFYEVYGDQMSFHEGEVISTNNQRRFAKAQHLASVTVIFLYTSTILTAIYLMCCISLLYGAVKYRREYIVPWAVAACVAAGLIIIAVIIGGTYPCITNFFGGYACYHFGCGLFVMTFIYAIAAVISFMQELGGAMQKYKSA